jgi:C-terminal processing protease CtpA/Prc
MARMKTLLFGAICAALTLSAAPQAPQPAAIVPAMLNFEMQHTGNFPTGWGGGPTGTIFVESEIVHGGSSAVRIERNAASTNGFSTLTKGIPIDFTGTLIEWRGFLKTENVSESVGLWMREDGDTGSVAFDNMQQRQVKGTHDWTEYSITLPLRPEAKQLFFGALVAGTGKIWVVDLQLLVDGKPIWDAPKAERKKTPLDTDREFDAGSGITISELTKAQIENLAMLGRVWGFLKYHHPAVVSGQRNWDADLFRVLPKVLAADKRETAQATLRDWVRGLGDIPSCSNCISLDKANLQQTPPIAWINQESEVGRELADLLNKIYHSRSHQPQFYVSATAIGNPSFDHELPYAALRFPDAGYQLLSLYRYWNMIEYWYPNRNILDQDWNQVLTEFIPRMALAKTKDAYQLETIELIARITDTHANLWSAPPTLRPPAGTCQVPVTTRFIENQAVVSGYLDATAGPGTGLKIGDVVETLDGIAVNQLVELWRPYYPASNRPTQLRDIGRTLTRGNCAEIRLGVRRDNQTLTLRTPRVPLGNLNRTAESTHDLPGDAFRLLSPDVAYLKLSSVKIADAVSYISRASGTRGLVIDIRNYPSEFVVFALGELLVNRPTPFVRITFADMDNPGAIRWTNEPLSLTPKAPHYSGKIVILVDENSQSQAEYTAMAFRAAPGAVVVGSTTAGADGNVSQIALPGGLSTMISGLGVFYPDKKPTQRIGIVPDIEARPTIAGIRAGRDEVLETALRQILGTQTPADQIEKMARP